MTWLPPNNDAATKARFIAIYGEELWNQIEELSKPKPLAAREVFKPRPKADPDRPATQTAESDDPMWWQK